jgi:hypothetical protein
MRGARLGCGRPVLKDSARASHGAAADLTPRPGATVQLVSIQTLVHRLQTLPSLNLIIFDERHHGGADGCRTLIPEQPRAKPQAAADGIAIGHDCGCARNGTGCPSSCAIY